MKIPLNFLFLILFASQSLNAAILTDSQEMTYERKLKEIVSTVFEEIKKDVEQSEYKLKEGRSIKYNEKCTNYDPNDEPNSIQVCIVSFNDADNSIVIEMRNPNNRYEIEFSNIDFEDKQSDIAIKPYVEEFLKSILELVTKKEEKVALIKEAINEVAKELGISEMSITENEVSYTYKNRQNKIAIKIDGNLFEASTDFFTDVIDLNIPLKNFILFETKKFFKEIITHLSLMQGFALSDGEGAGQSLKELTCEKVFKNAEMIGSFTERLQKSELKADVDNESITVSTDNKSFTIKCTEVQTGTQDLVEVTADYSKIAPSIQPTKQTFLKKSLYDFQFLVAAFLYDIGTFGIRVLSPNNVEERFDLAPSSD